MVSSSWAGAGFSVEEALGAGAAEGDEGGGGDLGFYSFGDSSEAEGVGEADDGPDDGQVVGVRPTSRTKPAVDLEERPFRDGRVGPARTARR